MHPDAYVSAIGVLLTGLGAVASAWFGYRSASKRHDRECDKRVRELRDAMMLGMALDLRDDDDEHEERWSHLP